MLILLSHLDVYEIADLMQHAGLKTAVENHFAVLVRDDYNDDGLYTVVKRVYDVAPPGTHGNELRTIMTRIVARHASEIFRVHPEFKITFENLPAFSVDLAFALSGGHPDYDPRFIMRKELNCYQCGRDWYSEVGDYGTKQYCPYGCENDFEQRCELDEVKDFQMISFLYTCPEEHRFMSAGWCDGDNTLIRCILCSAKVTKVEEVSVRD
jgi:hypothetical protein